MDAGVFQVVWFKRDLRLHDHAPLAEAARCGPVLPLYVIEPGLWAQPDASGRQWAFVRESLLALREALAARGAPLVVREGEMLPLLQRLRRRHGPFTLWSHQETGNDWTFARDRAVAAWCAGEGLRWEERRQQGVVRALATRDGWARQWQALMAEPCATPPARLQPLAGVLPGEIPDWPTGLAEDPCPGRQAGGRAAAEATLHSFLYERGAAYPRALSSPLTAEQGCSRLSPHLAWGTLSMREVLQAAVARKSALTAAEQGAWGRSLNAFIGRLHWHCHFIQKLETAPRLEFDNTHPAYDGLRPDVPDPQRFQAWCEGRTGWPFVDACQAFLAHHGWLNFRMRAMLMAVASYTLWLHWRAPALFLARRFVDYEPGIHYPQAQMQSGVTGINTIRIYNAIKQGQDHDPQGRFIRTWVPALRAVPDERVHTPWKLGAGEQRRFCPDYPAPLLDLTAANREARDRVWAVRRGDRFAQVADAIQDRHGSRKAGLPTRGGRRPRKPKAGDDPQIRMTFDE